MVYAYAMDKLLKFAAFMIVFESAKKQMESEQE
jgi:hypothetical protein